MAVYKNTLTDESQSAENKIRAWLYFFYEAERKGNEKPTMDDIVKIKTDKRTIDLKKGY
jgi:hypothetical protein